MHIRLALIATIILVMAGCANVEPAISVHDKELESYEYTATELTNYSLNLLAVMVQERLTVAQATHQQIQQKLINDQMAQEAVADELQYQSTLNALQAQVLAEFEKIATMHQGIAAARAFHDVVQEGLKNANKVDVDQIIQLAEAVTEVIDIDLGPLNDVIEAIKNARGLPEVDSEPLVPESN